MPSDQAGFVGEDDELATVAGAELGHRSVDVGFAVSGLITMRAAILVIGLIATALGGLALARSRRTGPPADRWPSGPVRRQL